MKKKFKKGSKEAKEFMATLRAKRKKVHSSEKNKTKRRIRGNMPKRKTRTVYRTKKRTTRRKKNMFSGVVGQIAGAGIYATIGEPVVDSIASKIGGMVGNVSADLIKLPIGYYLSKKTGITGGVGKAMLIVSAYGLAKGLGGTFNFGNLFGTPAATNGNGGDPLIVG